MKRLLVLLLLIGTLAGCAPKPLTSNQVDQTIQALLEHRDQYVPNVTKSYYRYYLPKSLGKHVSDDFNTTFMSQEHQILLTISAEEVMLDHDDKEQSNVERENFIRTLEGLTNLKFNIQGILVTDREKLDYYIYAYPIEDMYFVVVKVGYAKMQVIVPESKVLHVIEDMFVVGMTMEVDSRKIVSNFKEVDREVLGAATDLNVEYAPVNGYLSNYQEAVQDQLGRRDIINGFPLVNTEIIKKAIEENQE